jgi:hypothetical protein
MAKLSAMNAAGRRKSRGRWKVMSENFLYLTKVGIDTYQQAVVFMRKDCHVCRAEGLY